jgi:flavin-dependent dehydrogenase
MTELAEPASARDIDPATARPAPGEVCECDVLVIGGGPAGSTAAALLAERGRDVVLLEKDTHPRFHIGESLLPRNTELFDRLGLREQIAATGVHKPGAEFVSDSTGKSVHFRFADGLDQTYTHSWQVRRSDFDATLFANARARGARVAERTRVTDVAFGKDGARAWVSAIGPGGEALSYAPRFVLDASGRDTFLGRKMRTIQANKVHNTAALYGHFKGAVARTDDLAGYITVHLAEDGWFWFIPLPDNVMSIGFVGDQSAFKGRQGSPHDLFMARLQASPTARVRIEGAELISDVVSTGNYAYASNVHSGDGYLMIGDAFAFIDPVFSSGVLLAMTSGDLGASVADTWLDDKVAGRAMARRMERDLRAAMRRISWLIYRINTPALRMLFMAPGNKFRMRDALISLLAGNIRQDRRLVFVQVGVLCGRGIATIGYSLAAVNCARDGCCRIVHGRGACPPLIGCMAR